jgi:DNA-directed RNA polymerase I, II, and III subunit RPABC3
VSRIVAVSDNIDMELVLDVNTEIYPLEIGDRFTLLLASTLDDSLPDITKKQPYKPLQKSIADDYDYVMYGKVYKYDDKGSSKVYLNA